jgi:amino acid transporter
MAESPRVGANGEPEFLGQIRRSPKGEGGRQPFVPSPSANLVGREKDSSRREGPPWVVPRWTARLGGLVTMSAASSASIRAHKLGWALVFAVVYADIGTSIFYVPGILYLSIGYLATLAQIITTGVFISIALKYVEICERCPDGGGVVSICRQAFSAWTFIPLVGGSFITVDYFLTSVISGISGVYYLATLLEGAKAWVIPFSAVLFTALVVLNIVGIKESAHVSSWFSG